MKNKPLSLLILLFLSIRIFSYFFPPQSILNTAISITILVFTGYLLIKKPPYAWYIIAAELMFGGSGSFFDIFGVALRSCFLILSLGIYFFYNRNIIFAGSIVPGMGCGAILLRKQKRSPSILAQPFRTTEPAKTDGETEIPRAYPWNNILIFLMIGLAAYGTIKGYLSGHSLPLIISGAVPYLFLLYYFPLRELLKNEAWKKFCLTALQAAIIGEAIFVIFTAVGFGTGQFVLQDSYYHWFRDIAGGKITYVDYNFYRIVLNEQLLLVPIISYFFYLALSKKYTVETCRQAGRNIEVPQYLLPLLIAFVFSITRIYFLAAVFAIILLFSRNNWRRWLALSLGSLIAYMVIFSGIYLLASGGKSFGLEVFGLRLQSIVSPSTENSSLSRMLLLPPILEQIARHPVLGNGLGSTVTVFSPVQNKIINTPQYDWGYLQIIAELGALGLVVWLLFLGATFRKIKKRPRWLLASFAALVVINLTSPALFHVLGIIFLTTINSLSDALPKLSLSLSHSDEPS